MWRAVKYEEVNLKVYVDAVKARRELDTTSGPTMT